MNGIWLKDKPVYDDPAVATFVTSDAIYERFKSVCSELHVKPGVVLTNLMTAYVDYIEFLDDETL
jgi:hypothetical protein